MYKTIKLYLYLHSGGMSSVFSVRVSNPVMVENQAQS
jgi:hypothetical protein